GQAVHRARRAARRLRPTGHEVGNLGTGQIGVDVEARLALVGAALSADGDGPGEPGRKVDADTRARAVVERGGEPKVGFVGLAVLAVFEICRRTGNLAVAFDVDLRRRD